MAFISSEKKTSSGNLTIPTNCKYVVALVSGLGNPTINSVSMVQQITETYNSMTPEYISISTMLNPPVGTVPCVISQTTRFVYLSGLDSVRDVDGVSDSSIPVTLTSSPTDLILGVQVGGTAMTIDGASVTFLDNYYAGYLAAPDASVICDGNGNAMAFISIQMKKIVPKSRWW